MEFKWSELNPQRSPVAERRWKTRSKHQIRRPPGASRVQGENLALGSVTAASQGRFLKALTAGWLPRAIETGDTDFAERSCLVQSRPVLRVAPPTTKHSPAGNHHRVSRRYAPGRVGLACGPGSVCVALNLPASLAQGVATPRSLGPCVLADVGREGLAQCPAPLGNTARLPSLCLLWAMLIPAWLPAVSPNCVSRCEHFSFIAHLPRILRSVPCKVTIP